jgi:hypothetical protein
MDLGRLKRWTGKLRALTVIGPRLAAAPLPAKSEPTAPAGLASRSMPMSAASRQRRGKEERTARQAAVIPARRHPVTTMNATSPCRTTDGVTVTFTAALPAPPRNQQNCQRL